MQWSPRQRSADDEVDDVDDDVDDDVIETRHDVTVDSDDDVTSYLGISCSLSIIIVLSSPSPWCTARHGSAILMGTWCAYPQLLQLGLPCQ